MIDSNPPNRPGSGEPDDEPLPKGKKKGGKVVKAKGKRPARRLDKMSRGGHPNKWIQGADLKKGAFTAQAEKAGKSVHAFAEAHKHDAGKTGKRARLALTFQEMAKHKK